MNKIKIKTNIKLIEVIIILYFFLGMFKRISLLQYSDYILALIIQLYFLVKIFKNKEKRKVRKNILFLYLFNISIIFMIFLRFIYLEVDINKIINRIFPLVSIFGMIIINSINKEIDIILIIKTTIKLYLYLGIIIILDSLLYLLLGKSFWPPIYYLGLRFNGPFYDANFYGIVYASILIIILYYNKLNFNKNKKYILIVIINIFLAKSWSVIIVLLISILINKLIKFKNLFLKQILLILIYICSIVPITRTINLISNSFVLFTTKYLNLSYLEAFAKFRSFELRVDTQLKALQIFLRNILGQGPQQIVPQLGMDVHNSYIGFLFEMGILGIILLLINMKGKNKKYIQVIDVLTTFILIMAFTINVHYSVFYTLIIFIMFNNQFENEM